MSKSNALVIAILPVLILTTVNAVYTILLVAVFQYENYSEVISTNKYVVTIFINAVHLVIFYYIQKIIHKQNFMLSNADALFAALILLVCFFMSLCFETVLYNFNNSSVFMALGVCSVFLLCTLLCMFLLRISRQRQDSLKESFELQQLKQDHAISEQIMDAREQLYQLRHDIKHFMALIDSEGSILSGEAKKQSDRIRERIGESGTPITTPSAPITYVLNLKRDEAINSGIDFKCSVNLTKPLEMEDSDLYLLLSNLLDNAIKHIGIKKRITVDIRETNDLCIIIISNSIDHSIINPTLQKEDGHGFGISTIERIVKRYDGILDFSELGETYQARLILKLKV
jgi:hypothetical protein